MAKSSSNLIWIDLEMTGLNPAKDRIIEIATLVTDSNLTLLAEGPVLAINQPLAQLEGMDNWNKTHHGKSGLIDRVKESAITEKEAAKKTIDFLSKYNQPNESPMCGNSICQDRRFLANYMPELEIFFHYRNLDVSTLKELASRWSPDLLLSFTKKNSHQALDDIKESLDELRYYRAHFLKI